MPAITSPLTATGFQNGSFSYAITTDVPPTAYGAAGLPAGITVNTSTGSISGTPTVGGVHTVTVYAVFGPGVVASAQLVIRLNSVISAAPVVVTPSSQMAFGQQMRATVRATGGMIKSVAPQEYGGKIQALHGAPLPTGINKQLVAAEQKYTPNNILKCGTCPASVINVISQEVTDTLGIVRELKSVVHIFNNAARFITDNIVGAINDFAAVIPPPPLLDLRELLGIWTCPLTPQALLIEQYAHWLPNAHAAAMQVSGTYGMFTSVYWTTMTAQASRFAVNEQLELYTKANPIKYLERMQRMWRQMCEKFLSDWDTFVKNQSERIQSILRFFKRLWDRLWGYARNIGYLAVRVSVTRGSTALVRATCPAVYESAQYPFKEYDKELQGFSIIGLVPSGLEGQSAAIFRALLGVFAKIQAWAACSFVLVA